MPSEDQPILPREVRDPDLEGPAGQAWHLRPERGDARVNADHQAHLGAWLLRLPGKIREGEVKAGYAHDWEYYVLGVIHLRPIRGVPDAKRQTPDMGYEMVLAAVDPMSHPGVIDPERDWPFHFLEPLNWTAQWEDDLTDEQSVKIGESAVNVLCRGILPPEGHRDVWLQSIKTTVHHYRTGRH